MVCLIYGLKVGGPKKLLECHAIVSSLLKFVKEEVTENQLKLFSSSSEFVESELNELSNTHLDIDTFLEESFMIAVLAYFTWLSLQYFNDDKITKLELIRDYKISRKTIRKVVFVFAFIFLRNIDNAI